MRSTITGNDAKRAREALGVSQTGVAAAIDMNRTYYSLFEAGRYVLNEQEQQQVRAFLADALPAPDSGTTADDDEDGNSDDTSFNDRARWHSLTQSRTASPPPPAAEPDDGTEKAVAALTALRSAAAEPNGLRTKRTAAAVGNALMALQPLDYADLLDLADENCIPKDALPKLDEFNGLDLQGIELWESRVIGLLVCDALYGSRWTALSFDALKDAESDLHRTLGPGVVKYEGISFISLLWDGDHHHAPRRRAELAPFVTQAAQKRRAPVLAAPDTNDSAPLP